MLAVRLLAARLDLVPEHDLLLAIVNPRLEPEAASLARTDDGPAGEGAGDVDHVLLRVAAVHAERVQLHQLAAVVFVEAALLPRRVRVLRRARRRRHREPRADSRVASRPAEEPGAGPRLRPHLVGVGIRALPVVEIEEHRGALGRRAEQIAELAEDVRPDRVALVLGEVLLRRSLTGEHVEVIEPEIGHHFFELAFTVGRPQDLLAGELREHFARLARGLHLLGRPDRLAVGRRIRLLCHRRIAGRVLPHLLPHLERGHEVFAGEVARAHGQRLESGEARRHARVGEALRVQLLIDVRRQADLPHAIHVAGPRAVADPVQDMQDGLVVGPGRDSRPGAACRQGRSGHERNRGACNRLHARLDLPSVQGVKNCEPADL